MSESNRVEYKHELTDSLEKEGRPIGGAIPLTARQKEVVKLIQRNPRISYREISKELKINESAVIKHIKLLKEKGVLKREGGTRGYWKIIDQEESS